jgi:cytochrome b pre-mRNA-processing protein 3
MGVPDTREGRFELYTLHVVLILGRLKGQGAPAAAVAQALFDAYARGLDDAFRELGVGDLAVPKKMKQLGEAFYGRLKSYDEAFAALSDHGPLEALISRTLWGEAEVGGPFAEPMTSYVLSARQALERQSLEGFMQGDIQWPSLP